jgi:PST family polysaccharide transporter
VGRAVAFLGTAYIARTLGPTAFGVVGFAIALSSYFALAVTAGFGEYGAREVARNPRSAPNIARGVVAVRLVLACLAYAALVLVAWSLDASFSTRLVILLAGLSFFSTAADTSWVYKGLEQNARVALALVIAQVAFVVIAVAVVRDPADLTRVPLAQVAGEGIAAMVLTLPLLRRGGSADVRAALRLLRSSAALVASRVLRTVIFSFDVLLLGVIIGAQPVGLYTGAYRICFVLLAIASALQTAYLPPISRATHDPAALTEAAERAMLLAAVVAAPMVVGGMVTAPSLMTTVFGPEFAAGAAPLRLLILSIGFIFLSGTTHSVLLVRDRLHVETLIIGGAAILNVSANVVLIPRYGAVGAAFATALAEAVILGGGLLSVWRLRQRVSLRPIAAPVLAASLMGVGLYVFGLGRPLVLQLGLGCLVYVALLLCFAAVPREAQPLVARVAVRIRRLGSRTFRP